MTNQLRGNEYDTLPTGLVQIL